MAAPPAPLDPSTKPTTVSQETVEKAVKALKKWRAKRSHTQNQDLLLSDEFLFLVVTLKSIPLKRRNSAYKIPLPHPLYTLDESSRVCLFVDDRHGPISSKYAQEKIDAEGIPISKVIQLSKLKTVYRGFDAKRKLCHSFDMFFADKRAIPLLPRLLGKHFYKRKKAPMPIELENNNWKEQIERVCRSTLLLLATGTCNMLKVGKVAMALEEIVENVFAAIDGIVGVVPKKWTNMRSLHLKSSESLALPLYESVPGVKCSEGDNDEPGKELKRVGDSSNEMRRRVA